MDRMKVLCRLFFVINTCWCFNTSRSIRSLTTLGIHGLPTTELPMDRKNGTSKVPSAVTSERKTDVETDDAELTALERSLLLSKEQTDLAIDIQLYIFYVATVSAIPPTILNIIVFLQPSMRSGTSTYVIGLSFAQLLYVLALAGHQIITAVINDWFTNKVSLSYFVYIAGYGAISAKRCGYLIMCLVSVERLYAVVRPLHARNFFLSKHSVPTVCSAFSLSLWHIYIPCRMTILQTGTKANGEPIYGLFMTDLYRQTKAVNDAFSLGAKIFLSFCTLIVQLVLNVLTVWALRRHNMAAKQVTSSADDTVRRQRERQMTITILAATITFVVLSLPSEVHHLFYTLFPDVFATGKKYSNLYEVIGALNRVLTNFSAGVDFVWFITLSSAYRREFCKLFGCECGRKQSGNVINEIQTETEGVEP